MGGGGSDRIKQSLPDWRSVVAPTAGGSPALGPALPPCSYKININLRYIQKVTYKN